MRCWLTTCKTKSVVSNRRRAVILLTVQSHPKFRFPRDADVASDVYQTRIQHSAFLVAATCTWPVLMIKARPPKKRKREDEPEHQWGPGHRPATETSTHSEEQPGNLNLSDFTTGTSFPTRPFLNTVKLCEMETSRQRKSHPLGLNTGSQVGP